MKLSEEAVEVIAQEVETMTEDIKKYEVRHPAPVPAVQDNGPSAIVMMAMQKGYDPALIGKMMDLADRNERNEARKDFYQAVAEFKKNPPVVTKDKINASTNNSLYSSLGNLSGTVSPGLAKHGLSVNYKIDDKTDPKLITVTAILTHSNGHSDSASMSSEPDTMGPKGTPNKTMIHGRMSAVTSLMKMTYSAVTGIAAMDPRYDDDGNAAGEPVKEFITPEQAKTITDLLKEKNVNTEKWFADLEIETVDTMPAAWGEQAIRDLKKAAVRK